MWKKLIFSNNHIIKRLFSIRIGCASGFWGDTNVSVPQLIENGNLNYLVFDYLSEITMSLLVKAKFKDNTKGYTSDFLSITRYAKEIQSKNIKVIANAGGINPESCCDEILKLLDNNGVNLKVGIVKGDNIYQSEVLSMLNPSLLIDNLLSSNVYLGAEPIKVALDNGADIVITGRCVDSALVLGPLMHHYKWSGENYDLLAAGSLAGHLIECGAQVTGGIFTDWKQVSDWWNIGFPIVEVDNSGSFVVTKPEKTGGIVNKATVSEQLVYEIGDPTSYMLPDVICDFTNVKLTDLGYDQVKVEGATGKPPTDSYKVCSTILDKYRVTAVAVIVGGAAVEKGQKTANQIIKRVRAILNKLKLKDFSRLKVHVIGSEDSYGNNKNVDITEKLREAVIWISAEHEDQKALQILANEMAPAGTGMAPGLTTLIGGRPRVSPIIKLHSSMLKKTNIKTTVQIKSKSINETVNVYCKTHLSSNASKQTNNELSQSRETFSGSQRHNKQKLLELAYCRSGDKGDTCNIGVIARDLEAWGILKEHLTVDVVGNYLKHFFDGNDWKGNVHRYELNGIMALNFVLNNSLGGGGILSLNIDPQGKSYAQILLDLEI